MPVAKFYDIRPQLPNLQPRRSLLVTLAVLDACRQVKRNQGEASLSVRLVLEAKDMLMPFRTSLQLEAVVSVDVLVVDLNMAVPAIFCAGQPF